MPNIHIYTDGGCIGNPGPGGWAAVLVSGDHYKEISGRFRDTTNNRMELRGAIEGLEQIKRASDVVVITDSAYVRDGITKWIHAWQRNGWRTANKKPVKNRDLWLRLLRRCGAPRGGRRFGDLGVDKGPRGPRDERARRYAGERRGAQRLASDPKDAQPDDEPSLFSAN